MAGVWAYRTGECLLALAEVQDQMLGDMIGIRLWIQYCTISYYVVHLNGVLQMQMIMPSDPECPFIYVSSNHCIAGAFSSEHMIW